MAAFQECSGTPRRASLFFWVNTGQATKALTVASVHSSWQRPHSGHLWSLSAHLCSLSPPDVPCGIDRPRGALLSPQHAKQPPKSEPWKKKPFIRESWQSEQEAEREEQGKKIERMVIKEEDSDDDINGWLRKTQERKQS